MERAAWVFPALLGLVGGALLLLRRRARLRAPGAGEGVGETWSRARPALAAAARSLLAAGADILVVEIAALGTVG